MFSMKFSETFLILIIFLILNIQSFKFTKKSKIENFKYKIVKNFTIPEGPIYGKGWLKYMSYNTEDKTKPEEFLINQAFYEQMSNGETLDLTKSDKNGLINIPDSNHFFFILTDNTLNNNLAKTIDILNIDEIIPTKYKEEFQGGVLDHGDFKEGYCFKVTSYNKKKKKQLIWDICARSREEKITWMNTLYKLIKTTEEIEEGSNINKPKETLRNVTWVPITMWSDCTKSCGGGKSYLQRLCMAPTGCEGEKILTKDCNLQACNGNEELTTNNNTTITKPIMKYLPVSRRPLRYEKCIIKEGDLALYLHEGSIKGAHIPIRVILNNRTITAYSNDNYESIIFSHQLSSITGLRKYDKDNSCFEIEEGKKKTILCAFVASHKSLSELAIEWQKDILDFIKNCASFYSHELDYKEMTPESTQKSLDFYKEKEKDEMERIIVKTQQLALQAIEKELKVENLIEKEEEEKEKQLEEDVHHQYEKLKKQKELILQALVDKKKQADLYSNKLVVKKKIKQISEQAKREVMKIREDLRMRIISKQKDEKRKRELIMNKISSLKKEISKDLLRASRNGNTDQCNPDRQNQEIIEYCKTNFELDNDKMNDCVKNDNFCYMCCESEFGDLHLESRSNCHNKCDDFYIYKIKFKKTYDDKNNSNDSSIQSQESLKNKYLENNLNNSKPKLLSSFSSGYKEGNGDINKMIEEQKKKELLMNIKQDLNF